jgi:hypothetical protein
VNVDQFKNAALILKSFNKHGYICWLDFGSLLGLIRDGKMISWDTDIDMSFIGTQEDALEVLRLCYDELGYDYLESVQTITTVGDYHVDSEFYSSKYITTIKIPGVREDYVFVCHDSKIYFWGEGVPFRRSYPWIDIYPTKREESRICYLNNKEKIWEFSSELLEPLLEGSFMGNNFLIPNQSEKVLESHYSDSWRIPKQLDEGQIRTLKNPKRVE